MTGEIVRPGSYRISSAGTAMTALYAAGGPTEAGTLREIHRLALHDSLPYSKAKENPYDYRNRYQ